MLTIDLKGSDCKLAINGNLIMIKKQPQKINLPNRFESYMTCTAKKLY